MVNKVTTFLIKKSTLKVINKIMSVLIVLSMMLSNAPILVVYAQSTGTGSQIEEMEYTETGGSGSGEVIEEPEKPKVKDKGKSNVESESGSQVEDENQDVTTGTGSIIEDKEEELPIVNERVKVEYLEDGRIAFRLADEGVEGKEEGESLTDEEALTKVLKRIVTEEEIEREVIAVSTNLTEEEVDRVEDEESVEEELGKILDEKTKEEIIEKVVEKIEGKEEGIVEKIFGGDKVESAVKEVIKTKESNLEEKAEIAKEVFKDMEVEKKRWKRY